MNILLFAGTTEGKRLAERLRALPLRATICVASEYGRETLADFSERFSVLAGRMDADAMLELMRRERFDKVVDATHPYAAEASANIRRAAAAASIPCLRLLRPESRTEACMYVENAAAAAQALATLPGNVLLATGAKELAEFAAVPGHGERLYPRVLPTEEAIRRCLRLGFRRGNIIAMQGPFSREMNLALMRQFDIAVLVTKDGGVEGGFPEKVRAAKEAGARVVVVGRPPEKDGLGLDDVVAAIREELEVES